MLRMEQRRALILALIPVVMLTTACGSSGSTARAQAGPSQSASQAAAAAATAAPQDFTSKRYGFRVTLTKAWTEQDAQADWSGKELQGLASPEFANFTNSATDRTFVAAAAPVAKGMQLAAWRAAIVQATPTACTISSPTEKSTLGGEPALSWTTTCSDGYDVTKLAARHGTRGYVIFLASATANDNAADRTIFESIRGSFHFTG
jgi:hypothetical protein